MADEQVSEEAKAKAPPMTAEEFLTNAPLYTRVPMGFHPPREISLECWDEKCGKETSWVRTDEPVIVGSGSEYGGRPAGYLHKSHAYVCIKRQKST